MQTIFTHIGSLFSAIPFTAATWFVIATLGFFVWLFASGSKDKISPIKWEHLVVDSQNDRASPYKLGYLIGLIVATWIVITLADKDKLSFDMFGTYLTYLLGGASVNSFVKVKDETTTKDDPKKDD